MAQRFNVGSSGEWRASPEGTADGTAARLGRPFGTYCPQQPDPTLSRWAILRCHSGTNARSPSKLDAALILAEDLFEEPRNTKHAVPISNRNSAYSAYPNACDVQSL